MSTSVQIDGALEEFDWHSKTVEEVVRLQETDKSNGLSSAEAQKRLATYGLNELPAPPQTPFWKKVWAQLNNVLIFILAGAAIVAGVLEDWAEVGLICGVVILNVTIGLVQEGKAEKAADAIKGMLASKAVVVRDGAATEIMGNQVVPGDIVVITAGDAVPADLRVFEATNLKVAEDSLTGESNPVTKRSDAIPGGKAIGLGDRKNCCYSATNVQAGKGKGIAIATGIQAQIGKINSLVTEAGAKKEHTQLEIQLEKFGRWVAGFTLVVAGTAFAIAWRVAGEDPATAFKSAVAIAVAIIPEGLPAVVTISLALAMSMLAKNNAIVKKLPAVETLGSVTVICSDKTGTLTKNEMTVTRIQTKAAQYPVKGVGYDPNAGTVLDPQTGNDLPADHINRLLQMFEGIVLCNDATLKVENGRYQKDAGVPTEAAMCTFGLKIGCGDSSREPAMIQAFREKKKRVTAVPFASEHKFMCCWHRDTDSKVVMHVKGAPDRILPRAKDQVTNDDLQSTEPIDIQFWEDKAAEMSAQGLRVLAVARAPYNEADLDDDMSPDVLLKCKAPFLTMIGLVAILDPPREDAIRACGVAKKAGIVVKMITGDHPETATAIAKQLGIVDPNLENSQITKITGPELDEMLERHGEAALDNFVMSCNVFARASPQNKIAIVKSLKRIGQTASMTGDGVNDAPALAAADIGVAMGITGTDVSKEAAKMVLADDNFATIVVAVAEGRRVWDNLVKVLLYNMPVNFAQGLSVFFAYIIPGVETVPLTAIQVLYVNMITSVTMGLMLAMEPAEPCIMSRPPRRRGKRLFGRMVAWHCVYVSGILIVCVLSVFQYQMNRVPLEGSACILKGQWIDPLCKKCKSKDSTLLDCPDHCRAGRSNTDDSWYPKEEKPGGRRASPLVGQCERVKKARAGAFNMLVFGEIAYALNCRYLDQSSCTLKLFTQNKWAWVAIGLTSVMQVFLTYTPKVQDVFSNANIDGELWGIILGLMVAVFLAIDLEKTFAPKYLMPIFRQAGLCLPTADEEEHEKERFKQEAANPRRISQPHAFVHKTDSITKSVAGVPSHQGLQRVV